jgi:ankyrin repeat protein
MGESMKKFIFIVWVMGIATCAMGSDIPNNLSGCEWLHLHLRHISFADFVQDQSFQKMTQYLKHEEGCSTRLCGNLLHTWARVSSDAAMLDYLISKVGLPIDSRTINNETPLMIAAANGNWETTTALLKNEKLPYKSVDLVDMFGRTALHRAVMANRGEIIRALIGHGADTKIEDSFGFTPSQLAIKLGDRFDSWWALDLHPDSLPFIEITVPHNQCSGEKNHFEGYATNSDWRDSSQSSCECKLGFDVSSQGVANTDKITGLVLNKLTNYPLHRAVVSSKLDQVMGLLEWVNQADDQGNTPMHYYAQFGDEPEIFHALLGAGAKTNPRNKFGQTPFMLAVARGNTIQISQLAAETDIGSRDNNGYSALHYAVVTQNVDIVKWLMQNGAKNIKDRLGRTPKRYAKLLKNSELLNALSQKALRTWMSEGPVWTIVSKHNPPRERSCSLFSFNKPRIREPQTPVLDNNIFQWGGLLGPIFLF